MSIRSPASSRWSRGANAGATISPTSRTSSSSGPGAAVGSGRFASGTSAAWRSSSTAASSRSSPFARAATSRMAAISRSRSSASPAALMRALAAFCSARSPSSRGSSARRRPSSSITRSRPLATSAPRRASAERTPSGSSRINLRSSKPGSLPSDLRWRQSYFVESVMFTDGTCFAWRPEYSARNAATSRASSPRTMFSGMIAPEKPPLRIA